MAKIRNVSADALYISVGPAVRLVEPDEVITIPDDELASFVERDDGVTDDNGQHKTDENGDPVYRRVPSDLWVEVADIKPVPVAAPAAETPKE